MTLDLPDLAAEALGLLAQVPSGRVTTYGALARALGDPVAARWVGALLLDHPHDARCPCHRVVRADGTVGGYIAGNPLRKRQKLEAEGVGFFGERIPLEHYGFAAFEGVPPLAALRALQHDLAQRVVLAPLAHAPKQVAGVDVSYRAGWGAAVYALVEVDSGRLVWSACVRAEVRFPYISSYLAFRELPLELELLAEVRRAGQLADLVLVDGTGVLHPRRAGIACHLGVLGGVRTIGVTKRPLCGRVNLVGMRAGALRPVMHEDEHIGWAHQSRARAKPIYLSPGHGVDLDGVAAVVPGLVRDRRLPEPLFHADRLSRQALQEAKAPGLFD